MLEEVCGHDDATAIALPDHLPEFTKGIVSGSLRGDILFGVFVALQRHEKRLAMWFYIHLIDSRNHLLTSIHDALIYIQLEVSLPFASLWSCTMLWLSAKRCKPNVNVVFIDSYKSLSMCNYMAAQSRLNFYSDC